MGAAWLTVPERGSRAAIGLIISLTLAFGRKATRWLLYPICLYFYVFAPRARRASKAYLARVLANAPGTTHVLRHFHTFAATLHDRLYFVRGRFDAFDVIVHGGSEVDRFMGQRRGCLVLGSHLGSFEVLRTFGRFSREYCINVVMHEADDALARLAPEFSDRIIHPGKPDAMLRVKECLDRGEIVGMLGDRPFGEGKVQACPFLGSTARFPLGPWMLAAMLGVPVVLFFGLYRGGPRYDVIFEALSEGLPVSRAERQETAIRWLERYVARLEHHARGAPYNWFNFYDFWNQGAR